VFPSTVYSNLVGLPLAYEYRIEGDEVKIRTEFAGGATFQGTWGKDGESMSGGWRPDTDVPGNVAYDISGTRAAT
jgi:hypothetical protein